MSPEKVRPMPRPPTWARPTVARWARRVSWWGRRGASVLVIECVSERNGFLLEMWGEWEVRGCDRHDVDDYASVVDSSG